MNLVCRLTKKQCFFFCSFEFEERQSAGSRAPAFAPVASSHSLRRFLDMVAGMGDKPPDVMRKVKDGRPFIYIPVTGAGTNEGEAYYQKCLAEYCRDVGVPSSTEAAFLRSRRHRHRERPPGSKIREKLDLGRYANFIDVYQLNHQDRALDLRHVPRPAVARMKTPATSRLQDKLVRRKHMTDNAPDRYTDVFLQQAREAILQETQAVGARRAARARQLTMNPPQVYKLDWSSFEPFPHSTQVDVEDDADIAQELAWGQGTSCKLRALRAAGDGLFPLGSTKHHASKGLNKGMLLQSLPTEPTIADAAAMFRVTKDMASTLSVDTQPVVNSVGDILRHEKLRRLKKVVHMALLREAGSAASEFPERAPVRDAQSTFSRDVLNRETEVAADSFGSTGDQQAEVAMLMDAVPVDFHFLQRCGQPTEARIVHARPCAETALDSGISNERLLARRSCREGISELRSQETGGNKACTSLTIKENRGIVSCGEISTSISFAEPDTLLKADSLKTESPHSTAPRWNEVQLGTNDCSELSRQWTVARTRKQGARTTSTNAIGTAKAGEAVRWIVGQIRRTGVLAFDRGLKTVRDPHKLLNLAKRRYGQATEVVVVKSMQACLAAERKAVQLAAEIFNDQKRFMKQDDLVLYASAGDVKSVQKGLAEKRLCSVKGTHQEKGYCAFFAAGLSLITVESELRLGNRNLSNGIAHDCHSPARKNETATEKFQRHMETLRRNRDELVAVLEFLLEEGSDPNCRQGSTGPRSEVGWSLLHHLARVGDHSRLLWFLHHGAEVDPVDHMGTTPLFLAAAKGRVKYVVALLTRGADVRRTGSSGQTALHFAARGGGALVTRTLVAAGADPRAPNDIGDTPVDVARTCNRRATLDVLTVHRDHGTPASVLLAYIAQDELGDRRQRRTTIPATLAYENTDALITR